MKLVIFDCDGTLADSQHMITAAMEQAFREHDQTAPNQSDVVGVIGLSLEQAISKLLKIPKPGQDLINSLTEGYKLSFRSLLKDPTNVEPLFDGARGLVSNLSARDDFTLGVATGKSTRGLVRLLERENLTQHFSTLQTADNHPSKPHPSMIEKAMAEVGAEPRNTIMIGDTTFDIDMANAAGVKAIAVTWGYHPNTDLQNSRPTALVDTFEALLREIDDILVNNCEAMP